MAGICTGSVSPGNCGHRQITVAIDGQTVVIDGHENDAALSAEELAEFVRLSVRRLRSQGVTLASMLGRVTVGEEATNVKAYNLLGPGLAVTKTNIGTAYVNILPGTNGERSLVDFTGCTQYRFVVSANLVGTGPFGIRAVRDADSAVLYENANIAQTGERELDTDWQTLPGTVANLELIRVQAKSTVAADDPVFRRVTLLVR